MIDPFEFIREMQEKQKTCLHPRMTRILPRNGGWREVCSECGFARTLTAEESKAQDDDVTASIPRKPKGA